MKFGIVLSWICNLVVGFTCSTDQDVVESVPEVRYWTGIVTQRWEGDDRPTEYVRPVTRLVEGIESTQYEVQPMPPLKIRRVMVDSPASRAGLRPGDRIVGFNESAIANHPQLVAAIQANAEQPVMIQIVRGETSLRFELQPIPRPPDYRERVQRERDSERADLDQHTFANEPQPILVPNRLHGLLTLAAQSEQKSPENQVLEQLPIDFPEHVNFDQATRLLIDQLEQFAQDWNQFLEQTSQRLQELNPML